MKIQTLTLKLLRNKHLYLALDLTKTHRLKSELQQKTHTIQYFCFGFRFNFHKKSKRNVKFNRPHMLITESILFPQQINSFNEKIMFMLLSLSSNIKTWHLYFHKPY